MIGFLFQKLNCHGPLVVLITTFGFSYSKIKKKIIEKQIIGFIQRFIGLLHAP